LALALVRDMRELREPSSAEELEAFETDVLAGFVLARASAGLADSTIRNDAGHLDLIREWLGRPLWEMQPEDADAYFGRVLRDARPSTRTGRAAALTVYFQFLELRHRAEIYECQPDSSHGTCSPKDSLAETTVQPGLHGSGLQAGQLCTMGHSHGHGGAATGLNRPVLAHGAEERRPGGRGQAQRDPATVGGVPHQDHATAAGRLYAVPSVGIGVGALPPVAVHCLSSLSTSRSVSLAL
jgi:hypothetical protein